MRKASHSSGEPRHDFTKALKPEFFIATGKNQSILMRYKGVTNFIKIGSLVFGGVIPPLITKEPEN